jgi:hypothetical protein
VILLDVGNGPRHGAGCTAAASHQNRPAPEFLLFDGRTIPLRTRASIASWAHAFHHTPNPVAILQGFAASSSRVASRLRGARARHSRTPVSQFEMRNYRVVENDVDVTPCGVRRDVRLS